MRRRSESHSAVTRCTKLCIAIQNLSIVVNVVRKGSPSRMQRVRRISLGITILPRSSARRIISVAVPDSFVGFQKPSSSADRCHSLSSLFCHQQRSHCSPVAFICLLSSLMPNYDAIIFIRGRFILEMRILLFKNSLPEFCDFFIHYFT